MKRWRGRARAAGYGLSRVQWMSKTFWVRECRTMHDNRMRATLEKGCPVFGTMIQGMRSPAGVMIVANAGFDFVFLDMEHGTFNLETTENLIQIARLAGLTPIVRVPDGLYHLIASILDAGAEGVMVPRVENKEQVEFVVNCVKYPPQGKRGCSVAKGHNGYRAGELHAFTRHANAQTMVIAQIESEQAVAEIDAILSVPGVDVALVGPNDLALSLGVPMDLREPAMMAAIGTVVSACQRHDRYSGIHADDTATLLEWFARGMRVLTFSNDLAMFAKETQAGVQSLRSGIAGAA